jgi:adenylosuccinate synthase
MTKAFVVAGIGYGDEGKGTITDALVRRHGAKLVVRYNGGAQAAHNVVTPEGVHHTFAQFGSGAFAGAATYLGEHVVVDPGALVLESYELAKKGGCMSIAIHPRAPLVTPFHVALNRIRETARGANRHGSTGRGIGETVCDSKFEPGDVVIRADDLLRPGMLADKLAFWRTRKENDADDVIRSCRDAGDQAAVTAAVDAWFRSGADLTANWLKRCEELAKRISIAEPAAVLPRDGTVVFEGAQGVLLDETYGFHPYTTWSNTTFDHAFAMMDGTVAGWDVRRIGVTRAHASRHGPGPLPTEDTAWAPTDGERNETGRWQGPMRYGPFDLVAAEYALEVLGGVDELAMTWLDREVLTPCVRCASRYRDSNGKEISIDVLRTVWAAAAATGTPVPLTVDYAAAPHVEGFLDLVSAVLGAPITIRSYSPGYSGKRWSR